MSENSSIPKRFLVQGRPHSKATREDELRHDLGLEDYFEIDMSAGISIEPSLDRSEDTVGHEVEMKQGDIARLELDDGTELFLTPDSLAEIYAGQALDRSAAPLDPDLVVVTADLPAQQGQRGFFSRLLKRLDIFNLKEKSVDSGITRAGQEAIRALARKIESSIINDGGLYRAREIREQLLDSQQSGQWQEKLFETITPEEIDPSKPILLLIHGTFSSTANGFAPLLTDDRDGFWNSLNDQFGEQIYAFDHRTLTESPIENARALCQSLPAGAQLHLITHSRGGLVGEFLARGESERFDGRVFSDEELALFSGEDPDGTVISQAVDWLTSRGASEKIYEQHLIELKALDRELREKNLTIKRFVRVACPARGTTLASGRLDIALNVILHSINLVPGFLGSPLYGGVKTFLLAAIKDRTNPEALPGLEAQMPRSAHVRLLNQRKVATRDLSSRSHLAVIASDYEPTSKHRFYDWLVDLFYKGGNDLVVNFASMDGGVYRDQKVPVMVTDRNVMHTNYFANDAVRSGIKALLLTEEKAPDGFNYPPRNTTELARSRGLEVKADSPCVIIVPGISGSNLRADGDRIWVDKSDLIRGAFRKLDINSPHAISPDGPHEGSYRRLSNYLRNSHKVVEFSYDWRQSILDAGDQLALEIESQLSATTGPIRIVAHSMGGLVSRAVMARHPDLWKRFTTRKGARLLMLGTPNKGSYSILRLLVGQDSLINLLSLLDMSMSENEYLEILRRFPGVLELLPLSHHERAFGEELWSEFSSVMNDHWRRPLREHLTKAQETWDQLESVPLDPKTTLYVAGQASKTPCDYRIKGRFWKRLHFFASSRGDGRVLWDDGIPHGIAHWFSPAKHGDLANHRRSFEAIAELLIDGTTGRLPNQAWFDRGSDELTYLPPSELPYLPPESEIGALVMGGSTSTEKEPEQQTRSPQIQVSMAHGNLVFADQAVLVGHFINEQIEGSEKAIDQRLQGRLRERHRLGLYPESLNSSDFIRLQDEPGSFPGALVVGLGTMGDLTPGKLSDTLQAALLRYCLETYEEANQLTEKGLKICALIPGAGIGGVSISDSIAAVLRAAIRANELILSNPDTNSLPLTEIAFIELYEDIAVEAQHYLLDLQTSPYFQSRIAVAKRLVHGDGGLYRVSRELDHSRWQRLRITINAGQMSFLPLSDRAGTPIITTAEERRAVEPFLRNVTHSTRSDLDTGRVLHELLIPRALKSASRDNRPLILILDAQSAIYPWEILAYHEGERAQSIALRGPMVRQLSSPLVMRPSLCRNQKALVVSDPKSNFPPLPGAQREGREVEKRLAADTTGTTFKVTHCIQPNAQTVLRELMSREYQMIHLAGHGVFNYLPKTPLAGDEFATPVSGMVIGEDLFLTSSLIERLPGTPEFVFINCCHLGTTEGDGRPSAFPEKPAQLAANLATQLINQGVVAVIAAGWAVDDAAALTFADCFYQEMMKGTQFGEAVFRARQLTHDKHPGLNTWAAYQCYGDPSYVFTTHGVEEKDEPTFQPVSLAEAIVFTKNVGQKAKALRGHCADCIVHDLERFAADLPAEWRTNGRFAMTLGDTWIQLDQLSKALEAYDLARASGDSLITLRAIEKQSKNRARLTVQRLQEEPPSSPDLKEAREVLDQCDEEIASLEKQFGLTARRSACRGSIAKQRALLETGKGNANSREKALRLMEEHYRKSFEQTRRDQGFIPYPLNNLLLATFLRNPEDDAERSEELQKLLNLSNELALEDQVDTGELFWERAARPQQNALKSLFARNLESQVATHVSEYLLLIGSAGSPRQVNLVASDLYVAEKILADKGHEKLSNLIQNLREQL